MLLGYLEYSLLLFLPGLAALLVFNQLRGANVITVLARSYGLSLAINGLVIFVASTAVNYSFAPLLAQATGLHTSNLPLVMLGGSLLMIAVFGILRFHSRIATYRTHLVAKEQLASLFLGLFFAILVLSQFIKYPIFPKTYSVDFLQHFQIMQGIIRGQLGGTQAFLYYGVHYNLALGYTLVGGDPFIQVQYLMALLVAPSSLLFYEVARQIYNNEHFALLCQVIFVGTGFLWYIPLYDTGLYPNLYAIILSLACLVELRRVVDGSGMFSFLTFVILVAAAYLSHYFFVALITALFVALILASVSRVISWRRAVLPIVIALAPLGFLVSSPGLPGFVLGILQQTGSQGGFTFTTPFADLFSFSPFVRYSIALIYNYGSLVIFFGLPLSLYYLLQHRKDSWMLFVMPIWFVLLWVTAPNGELSWRFSFAALTPLILLTPATFNQAPRFAVWLLGRDKGKARTRGKPRPMGGLSTSTAAIVAFMFLLVVGGSWTSIMLYDLSLDTRAYSQAQTDLYDSMLWFSQNTPQGSRLLTVTDWRIAFLGPVTGSVGQLMLFAPAPDAIAYAKSNGYQYLLVTYYIPASAPPIVDLPTFYHSFENNQNLRIVYQNAEDTIYQIVG